MKAYTNYYSSPLGKIMLASDGKNLTKLDFVPNGEPISEVCDRLSVFDDTIRWLDCYFSGEGPDFTPPLKLYGTPFQCEVWETLRTIERTSLMTYGEIAAVIAARRGTKMSSQAVGGAVGCNPVSIIVPCHRVIGQNGRLTGFSSGLDKKSALLKIEGFELTSDGSRVILH